MTSEPLQLTPEHCRMRQAKVREELQALRAAQAIFVTPENVQYLTGFRPHRLMHAAVCLELDGDCTLSAPNAEPPNHAADRVVEFEAQWHATLRQEQPQLAVGTLIEAVQLKSNTTTAVEFSACGQHIAESAFGSTRWVDIDASIWKLRRHKYVDELAMIQRAIDCTEAMYDKAREIIEPGISELEVFAELQATAVLVAGEPLTAIGNDYQCNSPGGSPRSRQAKSGELFILDLGPCYRGYYADNCRTIAVDRQPTDDQTRAWDAIVGVLDFVEQTVKPGVSSQQLFAAAKEMLDAYKPDAFCHHLGHGFGLYPHEAPHLNPHWNDTFAVGDVFTAEPGLYSDELHAGIRLEQNYRVTEHGIERLTNFGLEM